MNKLLVMADLRTITAGGTNSNHSVLEGSTSVFFKCLRLK